MQTKAFIILFLSLALVTSTVEGWRWIKKVWHGVKRFFHKVKRIWNKHSWIRTIVHTGIKHAITYAPLLLGDVRDFRDMPDEEFKEAVDNISSDLSDTLNKEQVDDVIEGLVEMRELSEDEFASLEEHISDLEKGHDLLDIVEDDDNEMNLVKILKRIYADKA